MFQAQNQSLTRNYSLLDAILVLALATRIHGTDKSVIWAGYNVLGGLREDHQKIVLNIMNSPAPLKHMIEFLDKLPDRILTMRPAMPAVKTLPVSSAGAVSQARV